MLSIKNFLRRLKSPYNYNIGFVDITPDELIKEKGFGKRRIEWMRHHYHDRWFADPFIYDVTESTITVFAEEKRYNHPGSLVLLVVSKKDKVLLEKSTLLELPTHLSYPNPIRDKDRVYVYPENSQSGNLNIYEFDQVKAKLFNPDVLIPQPLNDATIVYNQEDGKYYMIATHSGIDIHNSTLLYQSDNLLGNWKLVSEKPIIKDNRIARPGGNFFVTEGQLYRPAQDCRGDYGNSLHIMKVNSLNPWQEEEMFQIKPSSYKYSHGLHTLNFHPSGVAVIDGNGYAYPFMGRIIGWMASLSSKR